MRAVAPLIEALKDPEWKVRESSAEALGYFTNASKQSIRPLLDCLQDDRIEVRRVAVLSLSRLGKGLASVEEALRQANEDSDQGLKTNALVALAIMGKSDDKSLPVLMKALGSENEPTALSAGLALTNIGRESPEKVVPSLAEALNSKEELLARNALKILGRMKGNAKQVLPEVAQKYGKVDPKNRLPVLQAVFEMDASGEYALPVCVKALEDPDPAIRKEALVGALRYRARLVSFKKQFIESLKDSEEENRLLAIAIVKGLGNKAIDAIPSLIALANEGTPRVRISALSCLGVFSPPSGEVIRLLEAALKDRDEKIRMAALNSFRTFGQKDPTAIIPILEEALKVEQEQRTKRSIVAVLDSLKKQGQGAGDK